MFIPGHLHHVLAQVEDRGWQAALRRHPDLQQVGYSVDEEHQDLAFHVLIHEGELARGAPPPPNQQFNHVRLTDKIFCDQDLLAQVHAWQRMHEHNYGSGVLTKMGLYVIRAGGTLGFHVDGPVILKGSKVDMSTPQTQRALLEMQASHRTILPLRFNPDDAFMVCNYRVPLNRGELFEFSNVVPHAYFNRGEHHAVMLVTTYLSEAHLPIEMDYTLAHGQTKETV